ncbi:MAG: hypothetical protein HBSIN02_18240 [Bacteroidia bacterium]|nr:MAG: hypothetical protein HBSIN02_18240 [Bacteroidia bacterium]
MKPIRYLAVVAVLVNSLSVLTAQDFGEQLKQMVRVNAERYAAPLLNGWGVALNSGLYHTADVHSILGFDVHIKLTGALIQEADKKYQFETPPTIGPYTRTTDYPATVEANSVVGSKSKTPVYLNDGVTPTGFEIPGGLDIPTTPLIVPQVSIGLPFGFEVMGRFFPTAKIGDVGKVNLLGFGLRHDIDQYIPLLPLDVAVHFFTQKLNYEDASGAKLLEASGTAYGVEVSKHLLLLTVYAGFQLESSSVKVGPYSVSGTGGTVEFTHDGNTKSRLLLGARVSLLVLNIHADYNLGTTNAFALGVGISFR